MEETETTSLTWQCDVEELEHGVLVVQADAAGLVDGAVAMDGGVDQRLQEQHVHVPIPRLLVGMTKKRNKETKNQRMKESKKKGERIIKIQHKVTRTD